MGGPAGLPRETAPVPSSSMPKMGPEVTMLPSVQKPELVGLFVGRGLQAVKENTGGLFVIIRDVDQARYSSAASRQYHERGAGRRSRQRASGHFPVRRLR